VSACLYILRCADGSYYVGTMQASLEQRIAQHDAGTFDGYTGRRRLVVLVSHEHFEHITDAIAAERQVKGWRRDKRDPRRLCGVAGIVRRLRKARHQQRASFDGLRMKKSGYGMPRCKTEYASADAILD